MGISMHKSNVFDRCRDCEGGEYDHATGGGSGDQYTGLESAPREKHLEVFGEKKDACDKAAAFAGMSGETGPETAKEFSKPSATMAAPLQSGGSSISRWGIRFRIGSATAVIPIPMGTLEEHPFEIEWLHLFGHGNTSPTDRNENLWPPVFCFL